MNKSAIDQMIFSALQAPASMKSVLQAGWLMTVAFGNLIVLIVAESALIDNQATEFFVFAGLMLLDVVLFSVMACFYAYVTFDRVDEAEKSDQSQLVSDGDSSSDGEAHVPPGDSVAPPASDPGESQM